MKPMYADIQEGSLLDAGPRGICTVVSMYRTGHQYERYYRYDLLTPNGSIIQVDEYEIGRGGVKRIPKENENV